VALVYAYFSTSLTKRLPRIRSWPENTYSKNIANATKKARREEHDPNLDLRVPSQSLYLKYLRGAPFWIYGSVDCLRYLYEIYDYSLYPRGVVSGRRIIQPILNLDLNLRALDENRYSKEFASEAKGHRIFQMAEALARNQS